jgi:hypothetical protein
MIQKLQFRPGIVRELTDYANTGGWYDADKVRFRAGCPEKIGGWQAVTPEIFQGSCRQQHEWSTLAGVRYLALGTHLKLYILWGSAYYDITPIRATFGPLPADTASGGGTVGPFLTYLRPNQIEVHVPAHGPAAPGDFVTFSGVTTPVDVYPVAELNGEFQVVSVPDSDHIVIAGTETMTNPGITGGGAGVNATFQIEVGADVAIIGTGWGVPPWDGYQDPPMTSAQATGWGTSFDPTLLSPAGYDVNQIRLWDLDNFGEDLVANIRQGPIYYWHQALGLNSRALPLTQSVTVPNPPGADIVFTPDNPPNFATQIIVSPNDRHLIALGCDDIGATAADPMLVRWSDAESAYTWTPTRSNSAGSQRLSLGSFIVCGLRTRQEILIWTDLGLWSMKYIATPYIFGFDVVSEGLSIIGPNAGINAANVVFWMDRGIFYSYTGQVQELPCTVKDYVFSNLNYTQQYKIFAAHNHAFSEVLWFYPSAASNENDSYVLYNYVDQTWSIGTLVRTSWLDMGRSNYPTATDTFGILYFHELGDDAGPDPLVAYVESSDLDDSGGDKFLFMSRLLPDVLFRGNSPTQTVGVTILARNTPGSLKQTAAQMTIAPTTVQKFVRVRARQLSVRVESDALGVGWRLGTLRADLQPDGHR